LRAEIEISKRLTASPREDVMTQPFSSVWQTEFTELS